MPRGPDPSLILSLAPSLSLSVISREKLQENDRDGAE